MTSTGDRHGPREEYQGGRPRTGIAGVTLSAVGIFLGFPVWFFVIPVMTMGTANCTDSSDELICNYDLMNVLAFSSLAGVAIGFLLTLTLGIWKIHTRKEVGRTLMTAWGLAVVPMLIFMGAGWSAAG